MGSLVAPLQFFLRAHRHHSQIIHHRVHAPSLVPLFQYPLHSIRLQPYTFASPIPASSPPHDRNPIRYVNILYTVATFPPNRPIRRHCLTTDPFVQWTPTRLGHPQVKSPSSLTTIPKNNPLGSALPRPRSPSPQSHLRLQARHHKGPYRISDRRLEPQVQRSTESLRLQRPV